MCNTEIYKLRLFVTGASPNSVRAITNLKRICDNYLKDNYELEIIDVYKQPKLAEETQLIALPMLLKTQPGSTIKLIGDMSDEQKVLSGLGVLNR